jgi:uncharacterized protein (TIGR00106 family)
MMLAEFSVVPIGKGESVSEYVADCLELVVASGIDYRVNPMGTVVEGEYDEVMDLIKRCHGKVLERCPRVITTIKLDDRRGVSGTIESKVRSVEERLGMKLKG